MHTANLRKVGGSVMLALPPAILELVGLKAGAAVDVAVAGGRLIVEPHGRRYTLDELIAQCDRDAPRTKEDRDWAGMRPAGREL